MQMGLCVRVGFLDSTLCERKWVVFFDEGVCGFCGDFGSFEVSLQLWEKEKHFYFVQHLK